jgi:hypothetical protein
MPGPLAPGPPGPPPPPPGPPLQGPLMPLTTARSGSVPPVSDFLTAQSWSTRFQLNATQPGACAHATAHWPTVLVLLTRSLSDSSATPGLTSSVQSTASGANGWGGGRGVGRGVEGLRETVCGDRGAARGRRALAPLPPNPPPPRRPHLRGPAADGVDAPQRRQDGHLVAYEARAHGLVPRPRDAADLDLVSRGEGSGVGRVSARRWVGWVGGGAGSSQASARGGRRAPGRPPAIPTYLAQLRAVLQVGIGLAPEAREHVGHVGLNNSVAGQPRVGALRGREGERGGERERERREPRRSACGGGRGEGRGACEGRAGRG